MEGIKLPDKVKNNIQSFTNRLKDIYRQDLLSVVLYGSASSGEYVAQHSNLNILVVLKDTDLANLKRSAGLIKIFPAINPLFLTEEYIKSSTDVFPIEFLDMQENYFILYGKDVLHGIVIDIKNLRFQCEQELKSKLINLRQAYLRVSRHKAALLQLLLKSFISILHILRNLLRLKGKKPPYLKQEILEEVALEFGVDLSSWRKILALKNKEIKVNDKEAEVLFINFVGQLEKIVDIVGLA